MSARRYAAWIGAHVPADPTGTCREITEQMAVAFPELTRVRGHYQWSQHEKPWPHWWLVTREGHIVDPTAAQWPDRGGVYTEHDEAGPEPTGRCANCGGYCYHGDSPCCSEKCYAEYRAYVMGGRP